MADPTISTSLAAAIEANPAAAETGDEAYWLPILNAAAQKMDDDIREELHAEMAPCKAMDFLVMYITRHYDVHGEWFSWT